MKTHLFILNSSLSVAENKLLNILLSDPKIKDVKLKSSKDKTILKIKSDKFLRSSSIKRKIISAGIYARKAKGFFNALKELTI